ncbi:mannose-1-phosphate guanylyltransferase/mannose-6-phosphate isomerase [Neisseria sp. Ec49-e6-T10]|uniref:mannose-1-phosphate guanylyltransferase/mannose-6-phosphate isomerase n=1 Tax=Neisseria sp. Ec49-e6-T10 TaxID=3140744 RepID=UPI003EBCEDD9
MNSVSKIVPVLLCGGAGSRLWPVSREEHPKPFLQIGDGYSLLQKAFIRGINAAEGVTDVLTVTNINLFFKTKEEFEKVNVNQLETTYILEPFGKNTAAAIASAALYAQQKYGNAILLVLPADHLIKNEQAFNEAVSKAKFLAEEGKIVTFGIKPTTPETGYGYIQADGYNVVRFIEKPSKDKAKELVQSPDYLWNSGIFCFSSEIMLQELEKFCPELLQEVNACLNVSEKTNAVNMNKIRLSKEMFDQVTDISIDYAVMEKSKNVAVVPCDIGWYDIGSWEAMGELNGRVDEYGNRVINNSATKLINTQNCYVNADSRVIGMVGVKDLIIVDTPDALLIADKKQTQDVKQIYTQLKQENNEVYKLHQTVYRPWGSYTVLENGEHFKIKRIEVKPQAALSLQMHHHRSEHWIVVSGMAKVINGEHEQLLNTNESTFIPAGHKHRLENPGILPLVLIEVQSGEYLGEDDIVRYSDDYGRVR